MKEIIRLEDLEIYQLALEIGDYVWNIVIRWDYLAKRTIGSQFIEAVDSIAANISEGYGRYFFKDRKQFCYYSRGSLMETKTWSAKAHNRQLITKEEFDLLSQKLKILHYKLNTYIKALKDNTGS
ncbi:four helix bundle protein [Parafilimonas terrae]|uniref:Four helix bundle protein n=1 Tax=Parafilimonas terrae TaxID=1465490 RepID=A0A1I5U9A2_9BACT|nr:four helix bundle protein [Parafilimonas terrae]SFP91822.1 four helix bundle protein [Parafilimonas terrae]